MISEDQVVALFAKANPVPSLDLLDPVEALDTDPLAQLSARSSEMIDVKADEVKSEPPGRKARVAFVAAMALIAVGAVGVLVNSESEVAAPVSTGESEVAAPVSTATAFMGALTDHDGNAALELLAPDATFNGLSPLSNLPLFLDLDRATGVVFMNQGCEERSTDSNGTYVDCRYVVEDDWTKALGLAPLSGNYLILIDEGQVRVALKEDFSDESVEDPWITFRNWVMEKHPDDMGTMYLGEGGARLDPDSIALFETYTDEFVADIESGFVPPVSSANAFMEANSEHDANAMWELLAPDSEARLSGLAAWTSQADWERAVGWDEMNQGCQTRSTGLDGTLVACPFIRTTDWIGALDLEPVTNNIYEILVVDGQIHSVVETDNGETSTDGMVEAFLTFRSWVAVNHPDDLTTMYEGGVDHALDDAAAIALFEQYTEEFVASLQD